MNSSEFDRRFEEGESVLEALDLVTARRPRLEARRVNVDFPLWMVEQLDREASRLGVTRQSIIKLWLAERLEKGGSPCWAPRGCAC
ncbi:MAG: CopG family transcriptional regulator [Cyanobacteriota bacterium]|nr:CopG family transcriptional regulator [Cyanobacteriota bacterium]